MLFFSFSLQGLYDRMVPDINLINTRPEPTSMEQQNADEEGEQQSSSSSQLESPQLQQPPQLEQPIGMHQQHPPRKMTKNARGQLREYYYLKTLKSVEELDKFRFKVIPQINEIKIYPYFYY
jgi:hypothetical protein